jgi:hypothetical protein
MAFGGKWIYKDFEGIGDIFMEIVIGIILIIAAIVLIVVFWPISLIIVLVVGVIVSLVMHYIFDQDFDELWGVLWIPILAAIVSIVVFWPISLIIVLVVGGIVGLVMAIKYNKKNKKNKKKKRHKIGYISCPYCYTEHHVTDCKLKCSYNTSGSKTKKCKLGIRKNKGGWIPPGYIEECLKCKEAAPQLFCKEVNKEIPIEFISTKSLPIALLGAKASGKSNYIGVLINEIRKQMSGPFNCSLSMTCSQESKQAYDDLYYRPLYEAGITVQATDAGVEVPPLIFPLQFMDAKGGIDKIAGLTFYDTAGENLDDKNVMHKFNRYITNADGIILLLDPLQVPNIRQKLVDNGFNALPAQNTEIYDVLSIIIDVIRNVKKIKGRIPIPIALVFTKTDVLEQYNLLPQDSCLRVEAGHIERGAFIRPEFENTNIHMQDLIDNWLDADLLNNIKQFERYSFFGVSSLGGNPDGTKIDGKGIRPRRVLDPLLWLLAEYGYIKKVKK